MSILVINTGSSSIKAGLFDQKAQTRSHDMRITNIGEPGASLLHNGETTQIDCEDHGAALDFMLQRLTATGGHVGQITAIGHRVVHGGESFKGPVVITPEIMRELESLTPLAPLHNPVCLAGIRAAIKILPNLPHVAVFDTSFHATLPPRARHYALASELTSKYGLRRFGFHGISHAKVAQQTAKALGTNLRDLRIVSCHLGNGASVTAIERGRSVETSMGMTPIEGLVMGSRAGDLDPGIIIQLLRGEKYSPDQLEEVLNHSSGLLGMTGTSDMRVIEQRAADGDESCRLAIHLYTHRVRKYIGAYAACMGGVDVISFTGGIGENSAYIRHRIAQRFDFLGAALSEDRNRDASLSLKQPVFDISASTSRVKILVAASNEEYAIAEKVAETVSERAMTHTPKNIPVAASARHVHLSNEAIKVLFGPKHELTSLHPLSQPGQFAANETVALIGPRNRIDGVRILGPARDNNQIEISRSDEFHLGIDAPVRASGDTTNTPGVTLVGPAGSLSLDHGVICALRHIHMHPSDAEELDVEDGDLVDVTIDSANRDLTFHDVLIRVSEDFRLEMHIDTDEANAAGLETANKGTLVPLSTSGAVVIPRRA